jgi:hypothetical protein
MTNPFPSSSPASPWTVAQAQAALRAAAVQLFAVFDTLATVHRHLPLPPDLDARQQGRLPYDQATDILGTIECVQDDCLRPAIASLERSSRITDAELNAAFRAQK